MSEMEYEDAKRFWLNWWRRRRNYGHILDDQKHFKRTQHIIEKCQDLGLQFDSFCELGFGNGRNLDLFKGAYPDVHYCGNDINHKAFKAMEKLHPNVTLVNLEKCDTLAYLQRLSDKSIDVIYTYGHLMHITQDVIFDTFANMKRVSKKYIIVYEGFRKDGVYFRHKKYRFERDYRLYFNNSDIIHFEIFNNKRKKMQLLISEHK